MIRFDSDYTEGAHPQILSALVETNLEQTPGYGEDAHSERARARIRRACEREEADVHFLVGGTQANFTVIASLLRPYQGVLCAESGHIACHETGAVEATGHKVLPLPAEQGKITASQVRAAVEAHYADGTHEHIVQPGMVYISQPTEFGTLYRAEELRELSRVCRELGLPLYVDGARLGYALAADPELTLPQMAAYCDVFTIGGTKVGLLFGEAVVFPDPALGRDFRYLMKQRGAMLAKGRLLGVQFEAAFTDDLYARMGHHAVTQALRIRSALAERGIGVLFPTDTNQQFPILSKKQHAALSGRFALSYWQAVVDDHDVWRICTSWATRPEDVDELIAAIRAL